MISGGRHQIGTVAGIKLELVAAIVGICRSGAGEGMKIITGT
jgi:hypothetical protein